MSLALEHADISVNEMAEHLDLSRTTISNYLHGRTKPGRSDLRYWALKCGVPFDWLVQGVQSMEGENDDELANHS